VAAWESACQDATRQFRPWRDKAIMRLLHEYAFPSVVDAVTPDKEVASAAKEEPEFLEERRSQMTEEAVSSGSLHRDPISIHSDNHITSFPF
jgi:hypothetical protein